MTNFFGNSLTSCVPPPARAAGAVLLAALAVVLAYTGLADQVLPAVWRNYNSNMARKDCRWWRAPRKAFPAIRSMSA